MEDVQLKTAAAVCGGGRLPTLWQYEALTLNEQILEGATELYSVRYVTICYLNSRNEADV